MADETAEEVRETDLAIVGIACRLPGAPTKDDFWKLLVDGRTGITPVELDDEAAKLRGPRWVSMAGRVEDFDCLDEAFFSMTPAEASMVDPQQRIFLECAWHAMEDAGEVPGLPEQRVGVYAGVGLSIYGFLRLGTLSRDGWVAMVSNDKDFIATRAAYKFNLQGPAVSIQTACSTSLVAIHVASQAILTGECDMAIAGGSSVSEMSAQGYQSVEGMTSPDGTLRAFDASARGFVPTGGVAAVVIKRLKDAIAARDRIYAVIRGSAINNDGANKLSYLAPSVEGQARVVTEALALADVDPATISYVEAHGTGTALGDPIEVAGLTKAYRAHTSAREFCALGSVKSNIGHTDSAAGAASTIKTALCLKHRTLVPTLHFKQPNPVLELPTTPFYVNTETRAWTADGPLRAGITALGIGGTNAHVILEEPPPEPRVDAARPWQVLQLSAKSAAALDRSSAALAAFLENRTDVDLADVAYTLRVGRTLHAHRRAFVAQNARDAILAIRGERPTHVLDRIESKVRRPVAFMFPGAGAQHVRMTADVYGSEPVFRAEMDRCLERLASLGGLDARAVLFPSADFAREAEKQILELPYLLGLVFAVDYSLARLWMSWGVQPDMVVGHSAGEYAAACLAGVFSLDDAIRLVVARGQLMAELPPAMMLSVALPKEQLSEIVDRAGVDIALVNAPAACVLAGEKSVVERLEAELQSRQIDTRRIAVAGASHCRLVEPILPAFANVLSTIRMSPPTIPFVSALTGNAETDAIAQPTYWTRHLRNTVQFASAMSTLLSNPDRVLLEVGPGGALSALARQVSAAQGSTDRIIVTSLRRPADPDSDADVLARAVGRLWTASAGVDPRAFHEHEARKKCDAPLYPFARNRHWLEPDQRGDRLGARTNAPSAQAAVETGRAETQGSRSGTADFTPTEIQLAAIWKAVLGVEVTHRDAMFFDLGGTSLNGLRLKRMVDEEFEIQLDIASMPPVFRVMAAWIDRQTGRANAGATERSEAPSADDILVPVRPGERGSPLFLVHGAGGQVFDYYSKSEDRKSARPVVGIRDLLSGVDPEIADVPSQARRYLAAIRAKQPKGPYWLGGHSYGGLVALEIANQLRTAGESIAGVILIDAVDLRRMAELEGDLERFLDKRIRANMASVTERLGSGTNARGPAIGDASLAQVAAEVDDDTVRRIARLTEHNVLKGTKYRIPSVDFPVHYFRAKNRSGIGEDRPEIPFFEAAGPAFHFEVVEGDHWTILRDPHKPALWAKLDRILSAGD